VRKYRNVARNTNLQRHPVAACRVRWQTLVPGVLFGVQPLCRVPGFSALSSLPKRDCSGGDLRYALVVDPPGIKRFRRPATKRFGHEHHYLIL
jgi:hypothetical protein